MRTDCASDCRGSMGQRCGRAAKRTLPLAAALCASAVSAVAQLSSTSAWPKQQRDLANSGYSPAAGIVRSPHVRWAAALRPVTAGEQHAAPVFSADNTRLYVGGPQSRLSAIHVADGSIAWSLQLGDGTGRILSSGAVGADGAIYVGSWDTQAPYDGFNKIRDDGDRGTLIWNFPIRRMLASPTITPRGLIVIGGQHVDGAWCYFGLVDGGASVSEAWRAARLSNPADPGSTGAIGATPAVSRDGASIFGGSDESRTFWHLRDDGGEAARLPLTQYVWAAAAVLIDDQFAVIAEGASFVPNDATEGKVYAFDLSGGAAAAADSLALAAGHLNGGAAAVHPGFGEFRRIYVPANGTGKPSAQLIALDFDPAGPLREPPTSMFRRRWSAPIGASASAYPQAVVTRDQTIYVVGPSSQTLYAVRDAGGVARTLWTLPLADISERTGWSAATARGPSGVIVGPDGTVYWHAIDGCLYAIRGRAAGDMDGDHDVDSDDLAALRLAVGSPKQFALLLPEIPVMPTGDLNGDQRVDEADIERLRQILDG